MMLLERGGCLPTDDLQWGYNYVLLEKQDKPAWLPRKKFCIVLRIDENSKANNLIFCFIGTFVFFSTRLLLPYLIRDNHFIAVVIVSRRLTRVNDDRIII